VCAAASLIHYLTYQNTYGALFCADKDPVIQKNPFQMVFFLEERKKALVWVSAIFPPSFTLYHLYIV